MKKFLASFLVTIIFMTIPLMIVKAAPVGVPILVDLAHGQSSKGLDIIARVVPEAQWTILIRSEDDIEKIPEYVREIAEIKVGDFATISLDEYIMIIIGQPQPPYSFTTEEIDALKAWFTSKPEHGLRRALWLAADSDYPAQGSEFAQEMVNTILEAIGAKLRMDYVSVEDPKSCAIKSYRVVGLIQPEPEVAVLGYGAKKVLFHGPGVLAFVKPDGTWVSLAKEKPDGVYIVARTSPNGVIVEHQPKAPGAPGHLGIAHAAGDTGSFVLCAVEVTETGVIIVTTETPYGGYQPLSTWAYYGVKLDGPRFVRNLILWGTGLMSELYEYEKVLSFEEEMKKSLEETLSEVSKKIKEVSKSLEDVKASIDTIDKSVKELSDKVAKLSGDIEGVKGELSSVKGAMATKSDLDAVKSDLESVKGDVEGLKPLATYSLAALGLAVVAIIIAVVGIALAVRKPK